MERISSRCLVIGFSVCFPKELMADMVSQNEYARKCCYANLVGFRKLSTASEKEGSKCFAIR